MWIVLAPVMFMLAAISTVKSDFTYNVQLIAFSTVAVAAIVCGVAALFRQRWAAHALTTLSWLAAFYFFVNAGAVVVLNIVPSSKIAAPFGVLFYLTLTIAIPGVPFMLMAKCLRTLAGSLQ